MQRVLLALALSIGALITYVDSRPTWDDTGVTVVALLVTTGVLGFLGPSRPWRWALAVGVWIPVLGAIQKQNYLATVALVFAFLGAYAGAGIRTRLSSVQ